MKITDIEAQIKRKGRYSVFVDNKFAFGVSDLGLINLNIKVGQELTAKDLDSLKDKANTDKIYNMAQDLVLRRPRSYWEITDYLRRKKVESYVAEEIIKTLTDKGYINDYEFATRWVSNRRLLKPISKRKLKAELRAKRVDGDIISKVLSEDETNDSAVIKEEIEKKRRQSKYQDDSKLMQYLARQGYSYEDIKNNL